jgi:hexosaminidase
MVDTSRNFISILKLKEIVELMSSVKLNVLHLHISDTASFPAVVDHIPELSVG